MNKNIIKDPFQQLKNTALDRVFLFKTSYCCGKRIKIQKLILGIRISLMEIAGYSTDIVFCSGIAGNQACTNTSAPGITKTDGFSESDDCLLETAAMQCGIRNGVNKGDPLPAALPLSQLVPAGRFQ